MLRIQGSESFVGNCFTLPFQKFFSRSSLEWWNSKLLVLEMVISVVLSMDLDLILLIMKSKFCWDALLNAGVHGKCLRALDYLLLINQQHIWRCLTSRLNLDEDALDRCREHMDALVEEGTLLGIWDNYGIVGDLVVSPFSFGYNCWIAWHHYGRPAAGITVSPDPISVTLTEWLDAIIWIEAPFSFYIMSTSLLPASFLTLFTFLAIYQWFPPGWYKPAHCPRSPPPAHQGSFQRSSRRLGGEILDTDPPQTRSSTNHGWHWPKVCFIFS